MHLPNLGQCFIPIKMGKLSRNSTSSQIWEKFVGLSRATIPWVHLPIKRVVMQRYRGIRYDSGCVGARDTKSDCIQQCWTELKELWDVARIPTIEENNAKKKLQELLKWFDKICANKKYLVEGSESSDSIVSVENTLNDLFDVAPRDVHDRMKSSLNREWQKDYAFYVNQQVYPQTLIMEGKDMRTTAMEYRREERIAAVTQRQEKEYQRMESEQQQPSSSNEDQSNSYKYVNYFCHTNW